MLRYLIVTMLALLTISCAAPRGGTGSTPASQPATSQPAFTDRDWIGVYASTSEIGGLAGTVLVLEDEHDHIGYRMHSYSDVLIVDSIQEDEQHGTCLIEGRNLYLPLAFGYMRKGKPSLLALVSRYTLVEINGRNVLMRDDALHAFREENKLYDYGILVRVKDQVDFMFDLQKVEHPSVKTLYADPTKKWNDPFVHDANNR